jgi:hypothetical protein
VLSVLSAFYGEVDAWELSGRVLDLLLDLQADVLLALLSTPTELYMEVSVALRMLRARGQILGVTEYAHEVRARIHTIYRRTIYRHC